MLKQSINDRKTPAYSVGVVVFWARPLPQANTLSLDTQRETRRARFWCWRIQARSVSKSMPMNAPRLVLATRSGGREYRLRYFRNHPRGLEGYS
jgi:hypothetical protein